MHSMSNCTLRYLDLVRGTVYRSARCLNPTRMDRQNQKPRLLRKAPERTIHIRFLWKQPGTPFAKNAARIMQRRGASGKEANPRWGINKGGKEKWRKQAGSIATQATRGTQATMAMRCLSLSRAKTFLLISSTASNPSLPRMAFCRKRSTVKSSMLFLIFCQPPQKATT